MTLHAIAEAQKAGGQAVFIDAEHAFDRIYAAKLGIKLEDLIISQPDNGDQALEIADNLIRSGAMVWYSCPSFVIFSMLLKNVQKDLKFLQLLKLKTKTMQ